MSDGDRIPAKELLPLINDFSPKRVGGWVMFHCPVPSHGSGQGDRDRSAGIGLELNELRCFAGCDFKVLLETLRSHAGERPRQARQEGRSGPKTRDPEDNLDWSITRVYRFVDPATGKVIAEHVRLEAPDPNHPKGHRKRYTWRVDQLDPRTLAQAGLKIEDLPLWGLESLPEDLDVVVHYPEGEKCAQALHERQLPAVASGGGSSQKVFGASFHPLRGRVVWLWPDNDPQGFAYMQLVKREMLAAGVKKVVIMPPWGGQGQDIADALAAGVPIEELLAGQPQEDHVEYHGDDHLAVHLVTEVGSIQFDLEELSISPRAIDCAMTTSWSASPGTEPHWGHVNLLSPSGMEGRARVLTKHFPEAKANWTQLLNRCVAMVREALDKQELVEEAAPSEEAPGPASWVLRDYVVEGGGTFLYGQPGGGKSQLGLAWAVIIDSGWQNGWAHAPRSRRVLYVNIERSAESMRARLGRVNRALGLPFSRPLLMVNRRGSTLAAILPALRRAIKRYGVDVVCFDSISRGGFGKLVADDVANNATDSLNSLGVTWYAIGHQRKEDEEGYRGGGGMFGSIHFAAAADVMVELSSRDGADGHKYLTLTVEKANDVPKAKPLSLVYEFDEDGLTAIHRPIGAKQQEEVEETRKHSLLDLCLQVLRDEGEQNADKVATILHRKRQQVGRELNKAARDGTVISIKRGRAVTYRLASETPQETVSDDVAKHVAGPSREDMKHETRIPPPLGGNAHVSDSSGDGVHIACQICQRDGMPLAGYDDQGRELCPGCFDSWKETA